MTAPQRTPLALLALTLTVLAVAGGLAVAPGAGADADPASDVLLTQNRFLPYAPNTVSPCVAQALTTVTDETLRTGFPLKVAVIAIAFDMGAVSDLFAQPQRYAVFLASEISFNRKLPVLIVMPAGFGQTNAGPSNALSGLTVDARHGSDGLARSAIAAAVRLAAANGHPVSTPKVSSSCGSKAGGGTSPLIVVGGILGLLAVAFLASSLVGRRQDAADHEAPTGDEVPTR
jgi:hypothetical protein